MSKRVSSSATSISGDGLIRCKHNIPAVVKTSGTNDNPGRRFYGCPYWKDVKKNCRFFRWAEKNDDVCEDTNIERLILQLEESLSIAESKAERRKKEKKRIVEEGRKVNEELRAIRFMLTVIVVLNAFVLFVVWSHQFVI
ncbi:unnamed protein product [Linum trigynum]|uniref:GRF-type domain-containing protein n=1 Tax=Linum trigynum TaxID=586398 RepID=A0AAV2GCJ6_9ROSI